MTKQKTLLEKCFSHDDPVTLADLRLLTKPPLSITITNRIFALLAVAIARAISALWRARVERQDRDRLR